MMSAARPNILTLLAALAALAVAAALFAIYVYPAHAQDGSAPDKPTGLTGTATYNQVVLTWDDPDDESITGYVILRRVRVNDQGGGFSVLLANTGTAALTYTDNEVAASTTYTYRIKAINEHGTSERSRWYHIDTPAPPVPDKPRGLDATATHDAITLTWDDPDDDSITGYVILRRLPGVDAEGHFDELVANTGTAATTYTDGSVAAETRYTYRIKAINEYGTSERSRWYHIDTPAAPEPDSNSPATGAPAITGTAQVGETLTVDTSGIADEDGLTGATFSYQWLSSRDTAISGATGSTYTLVSTDLGKIIKVKVTFTDDAGNSETLTSAATPAVEASTNSAGICDRTAQVWETILDQLPDTSDCAAVTDTELSGIIRLALSEKGITTLKSGDFSGLSNLQHLNLVDNELSALSDGIFDDLTGLQELSLFDNRISRLPDDIFDNLTELQWLDLGNNDLSELPDGAFDNLTGLQSLGLGDNSLSELPDGAFDNLTELQWLDLGNNEFKRTAWRHIRQPHRAAVAGFGQQRFERTARRHIRQGHRPVVAGIKLQRFERIARWVFRRPLRVAVPAPQRQRTERVARRSIRQPHQVVVAECRR